jgi:hypothetical protein
MHILEHHPTLDVFRSQRKEVFCKIRVPLVRLQKHADLIDYKLELDPKVLKEYCSKGREVRLFVPAIIQIFLS